ncbi:bifunctional 3-dehydroquinate dehydratase/shikimate dehydrogenase [Pyrus ussuriensis x Pyrus communis]|uniref:Bifunctional 3-dehydroquinate dehydratase/shikimate dehydrogenase n=1 Tax=Pyrus ussuriensis x Pyrus communis TaxID=2448454 RepID=A0A5N5F3C3_9ROSA|nr:bifunctional 3-dehydroquinate dehydratase/shikimate dehydrogenase [Pyrus ussuriensis x Pyrus communis]
MQSHQITLDDFSSSAAAADGLEVKGNAMTARNSTLLCVPIMAETVEQMVIDMGKAKAVGADLVEIRLDCLKVFNHNQDLKRLVKECPLPTLFSYRPKWEGGQYDGDEKTRLDALRLVMELGADYIDVELQVAREFINSINGKKPEKFKVIVSSHNFQDTPSVEALGNLVARIQATGADIVKIATTSLDITDVARTLQITVQSQVPLIGLVLGERGLISRILSAKFWGYLTYGTLESGMVSAPTHPTIKDLLHLYNFRQIGPDTKVFGVISKPVSHSKSPKLYNEVFKSIGFNGVYAHLLVDDIEKFFQTYSCVDFAGFSVGIPHKEAALKCCDEVDPVAKSIGAINCIIRRPADGKLYGFNTDYVGAISAIEEGLKGSHNGGSVTGSPLAGRLFVVIGAGGASKALAYGAKQKGARILIANRTYDRARELADTVGGDALSLADLCNIPPEDGMILANTTSIGMQPNVGDTPISKDALKFYSLVFDAIYTPKMTRLLREAKECGVTIVSGLEMFIGQAYQQFEKFTGLPAPKELFRKVMENHS